MNDDYLNLFSETLKKFFNSNDNFKSGLTHSQIKLIVNQSIDKSHIRAEVSSKLINDIESFIHLKNKEISNFAEMEKNIKSLIYLFLMNSELGLSDVRDLTFILLENLKKKENFINRNAQSDFLKNAENMLPRSGRLEAFGHSFSNISLMSTENDSLPSYRYDGDISGNGYSSSVANAFTKSLKNMNLTKKFFSDESRLKDNIQLSRLDHSDKTNKTTSSGIFTGSTNDNSDNHSESSFYNVVRLLDDRSELCSERSDIDEHILSDPDSDAPCLHNTDGDLNANWNSSSHNKKSLLCELDDNFNHNVSRYSFKTFQPNNKAQSSPKHSLNKSVTSWLQTSSSSCQCESCYNNLLEDKTEYSIDLSSESNGSLYSSSFDHLHNDSSYPCLSTSSCLICIKMKKNEVSRSNKILSRRRSVFN